MESFRRYVDELGYDWERGHIDEEGYYISYYASENQPAPQSATTRSAHAIPNTMLQAASSSWRQELQPYDASSGEEQTMPSRNTRGRFTSIQGSPATPTETRGRNHRQSVVIPDDYPSLLRGAQGNIIWKEGETAENAVGVANIATAAINILRHLINAEGALVEEDFQRVKEFVNFVNEDDLKRHVQELTPLQQATPQRRLTSTFLSEESAEAPVQRRLFGLTPTPAKRKKPRLLEELEQESDAHAEDVNHISSHSDNKKIK